jgi:MFS family permease
MVPGLGSALSGWLLGLVLTLALVPSNVVATALPLLRSEWGASAAEMGAVFAAYQVGYVAAVLFLLPLTDRVPAARVIVGGSIATAAAFLLFPLLARDPLSASVLRALAGAGLAGVYLPGVRVVAAIASQSRRGLAVGLYVSAFYFGSSISLWATGVLLGVTDWRGASLVLGGLSAMGVPLALVAAHGAPAPEGAAGVLRLRVLRHERLLRTILAYSGHSFELYVGRGWLAAFLATVLAGTGMLAADAAAEGGKWAALMAGVGTAGVWIGGWLSDRLGRAPAAMALATASGLVSLAFGWLGGVGWVLLVLVGCAYGLLTAADSAIYSTAVTEVAPPDELGSAQAAQAFLGFLTSAIAPVAAGFVLDLGGGFGGAFVLAGLASLAGAAVLAPMARPAGRQARRATGTLAPR